MNEEEISRLLAAVEHKIEKTVNGKINRLTEDVATLHTILEKQNESTSAFHDKVDARFDPDSDKYILKDVVPFLQGAKGLKIIRDFAVWVGGIFIAYVAIRNSIKL